MERSWNQVGIDAQERYDELSHKGWDWSSFYNGYLEGTEAERKATKPLDLGSVVEAFTSLVNLCDNLANLGYVHKDDGLPISFSSDGALEKARQSILTLRSTVTLAPVAIVDTIEQALKFYAFSDNKIDGTPIRDIACRVATTLRSTVTPAKTEVSSASELAVEKLVADWDFLDRNGGNHRQNLVFLKERILEYIQSINHAPTATPAPVANHGCAQPFGDPEFYNQGTEWRPVCGVNGKLCPKCEAKADKAPVSGMTTDQLYDEGYRDGLKDGIRDGKKEVTPAPVAKVVVDLSGLTKEHLYSAAVDAIQEKAVPRSMSGLQLVTAIDAIHDDLLTLLARLPGVEVRGV